MRADEIVEVEGALIVGAGVAGLFTALKLAPFPAVVLAGARPGISGSSAWAQGVIAAAVGGDDNWRCHAADTIKAGAGLCDRRVVEFVTQEAPSRIEDLIAFGAPFDRNPNGMLAVGREAAHSRARIVHVAGDRAGAEVTRVLAERALTTSSITFAEGCHAVELAMEDGRIRGVFAHQGSHDARKLVLFSSSSVILATGGIGALYAATTNPLETSGQGLGMAARAGAAIADAEFVQFHPTAIAIGRDPAPLATEALRGEGAVLIDDTGRRFMLGAHPDAELAPRDVVARTIHREMIRGRRVFLDCRGAIGARFSARFPTVYAACKSSGIDPAVDLIPVAPAAHYHMGGIATGEAGRSSLPGLWAVGECASTGLHGANRLASNSLLEALVFGARVADDVRSAASIRRATAAPGVSGAFGVTMVPPKLLRETMSRRVGMERDEDGLREALTTIIGIERFANAHPTLLNMTAAARLITVGALSRRESRGAHFRIDYTLSQSLSDRSRLTMTEADRLIHITDPARSARFAT